MIWLAPISIPITGAGATHCAIPKVIEPGPQPQSSTDRPGDRNGRQGMISHTDSLVAGRWLLAEEVHGMALGQKPRNEVTDLTLAPAL